VGKLLPIDTSADTYFGGLNKPMPGKEHCAISAEGSLINAPNRAIFPKRCVKCNCSAGVTMTVRRIWLSRSWIRAFLGVGGRLQLGKSVVVQVGMCSGCRWSGLLFFFMGLAIAAASATFGVMEADRQDQTWTVISIIGVFVGLVVVFAFAEPLHAKTIENDVAQLSGAGRAFLKSIE
jgi:hypothetical protein